MVLANLVASFYRLDPIWTVNDGSLFLLEVEAEQLFLQDGMKLLVKDYDQFGSNDTLGFVQVHPTALYKGTGERMEFKLQPLPGKKTDEVPGYLAIRCRRATVYDKEFMEGLELSTKAIAVPKAPRISNNAIKSIVSRTTKVEDGIKRVSPHDAILCCAFGCIFHYGLRNRN